MVEAIFRLFWSVEKDLHKKKKYQNLKKSIIWIYPLLVYRYHIEKKFGRTDGLFVDHPIQLSWHSLFFLKMSTNFVTQNITESESHLPWRALKC